MRSQLSKATEDWICCNDILDMESAVESAERVEVMYDTGSDSNFISFEPVGRLGLLPDTIPANRNAVDIVAVHGLGADQIASWKTQKTGVNWLCDILPTELDDKDVRIMTFGYNTEWETLSGDEREESLRSHAETLLEQLKQRRRSPEETSRPILFMCHSLGGLIVEDAIKVSQSLRSSFTRSVQQVSKSTYAVFSFETDSSPHGFCQQYAISPQDFRKARLPEKENFLAIKALASSDGSEFEKEKLVLDELRETSRLTKRFENLSRPSPRLREMKRFGWSQGLSGKISSFVLAAVQLGCTAVVGDYTRSSAVPSIPNTSKVAIDRAFPQTSEQNMLWQCSQIGKHCSHVAKALNLPKYCGSMLPQCVLKPSSNLFAITCIAYGISTAALYYMNSHHRYQAHFLAAGLLVGLVPSVHLHLKGTTLNVVTTVMPTSITLFLVLSALTHSVFGLTETAEEEVFRIVERWARNIPSEESDDVSEKDIFSSLISV